MSVMVNGKEIDLIPEWYAYLLQVVTSRWEEVRIPMADFVSALLQVFESKSIECAKKAMREYTETFTLPWNHYDNIMVASAREVVNQWTENGYSAHAFLEAKRIGSLIDWECNQAAEVEYTIDEWSDVLNIDLEKFAEQTDGVSYLAFDDAVRKWRDEVGIQWSRRTNDE